MSEPSSKLPNLTSDTEEFLFELENENYPALHEMEPENARELLENLQNKTRIEIDASVEDTNIFTAEGGNVDVRIIRPKDNGQKLPAIVYVHGGGWVLGSKETHDMLIRKLSNCTESAVFFVNYSKSPETQYPVAFNQVYGVADYIFNHPDEFNINSDKIAIAGDSAGGNMAAAAAIRAAKENGPKFVLQALFYPVTNADMDTKSYDRFKDGPWLTKKSMEWFFEAYAPEKKDRNSMYVSPLKAETSDLKGTAPALVITDENDVLRDEGEAYARKLDSAGVKVLNVRINGTHHDFLVLNALAQTEPAKGALALICTIMYKFLH